MILRVQDENGRGPWRPGFSIKWSDKHLDPVKEATCRPVYEEVEDFQEVVRKLHRRGLMVGCAAKEIEGLMRWFSREELSRLKSMGFDIYDVSKAKVEIETPSQVVISARHAFRKFPKANIWDKIEALGNTGSIWSDHD